MKSITLSILMAVFFVCTATACFAQVRLDSAFIKFHTPPGDDKDWNTRIVVNLYLSDGTLAGTADHNYCPVPNTPVSGCFCCVEPVRDQAGRIINNHTRFGDGTTTGFFPIQISSRCEKDRISTGFFTVNINPVGNDRWIFIPTLKLKFSDGTTREFNRYPSTIVAQDARQATLVFY